MGMRVLMAAMAGAGNVAVPGSNNMAQGFDASLMAGNGCNGMMGQVSGCGMVGQDSSEINRRDSNSQPRKNMPEGSWICLSCHNVNFPNRDICNKRVCARPRSEVDGGPPPGSAGAMVNKKSELPSPDGSWVCSACGNVNWPLRTTCNRKTCGQPRDSGVVNQYSQPQIGGTEYIA